MVDVDVLLPKSTTADAQSIVERLRDAGRDMRPFDPRLVDFLADLSRHLRKDPAYRGVPAIAALAFWIRPANIDRLRQDWLRLADRDAGVTLSPRGVAFHMPPTNVDTLFVYSWLLSALVGNANVVRISTSIGGEAPLLLDAIRMVSEGHSEVAETMAFVQYHHETAITEALSTADVRVVWGGDATIRAVRSVPMNPHGIELTFADRYSMAAFDAAAVVDLTASKLDQLGRNFFNDAYWFDQLGCSSPRVVFWKGHEEVVGRAQERFLSALTKAVADHGYETPTGVLMNKLVRACSMAADGTVSSMVWDAPELTVVNQPLGAGLDRDAPGSGMFSFRRIDSLTDIVPSVRRRDQTLSHFGFSEDQLDQLVHDLNGVGIDRLVPVGSALQFGRFWDGYDLLDAFCRRSIRESFMGKDDK